MPFDLQRLVPLVSEATRQSHVQDLQVLNDAMVEVVSLRQALRRLLSRDERNTCQHENTHRGGYLWEICDDCGAKWADDEGGKPAWVDPPEWVEAYRLLERTA